MELSDDDGRHLMSLLVGYFWCASFDLRQKASDSVLSLSHSASSSSDYYFFTSRTQWVRDCRLALSSPILGFHGLENKIPTWV